MVTDRSRSGIVTIFRIFSQNQKDGAFICATKNNLSIASIVGDYKKRMRDAPNDLSRSKTITAVVLEKIDSATLRNETTSRNRLGIEMAVAEKKRDYIMRQSYCLNKIIPLPNQQDLDIRHFNALAQKREYARAHRKEINKRAQKWTENHRDRVNAAARSRYANDNSTILSNNKTYYQNNKEKINRRRRERRAENKHQRP